MNTSCFQITFSIRVTCRRLNDIPSCSPILIYLFPILFPMLFPIHPFCYSVLLGNCAHSSFDFDLFLQGSMRDFSHRVAGKRIGTVLPPLSSIHLRFRGRTLSSAPDHLWQLQRWVSMNFRSASWSPSPEMPSESFPRDQISSKVPEFVESHCTAFYASGQILGPRVAGRNECDMVRIPRR